VDAFGDEHERVFAVREPGQHVECLVWRGRAIAQVDKPQLTLAAPNGGSGRPREVADAFFGDGRTPTPRYAREQLGVEELCGPAIVDEPGTTIVVPPGWRLAVLPLGDFLLRRAA
jgi:N-methylhydantoinase A